MLFNSFDFILLFPLIFCFYYIIQSIVSKNHNHSKLGNYVLIIISYSLYIKWNPVYSLILLGVTIITYFSAKLIDRNGAFGKKKTIVWTGVLLALFPLIIFKYYNFISEQLTTLLAFLGVKTGLPGMNLILPLGLSFYTLQAIGYLTDVYLQRIKAEHNWWDYMLFICFFPQIASGPISKAKDLLPQIKSDRVFSDKQFIQGLKWLLWGMFLKVVVADRLALNVNDAYIHLTTNSGLTLFLASIAYSMQLYCDFAGYSFMALGVGEVLGFELVNNFRQPYLSQSVTEFWRRWHISLSTWLKDYIYIPLGGSRCSKKKNYLNIMVTFLVSGLWHGANWTFIIWGGLHGLFQVIEKYLGLNKIYSSGWIKAIRIVLTFLLINFALIFFRMPTINDAFFVIAKIFTDFNGSVTPWISCFFLSAIVLLKDVGDDFNVASIRLLHSNNKLVRWGIYLFLFTMVMVFGVYGGQFIYSGF